VSTQHYLRQPTVHRLPQLLDELKSGALRIPPFQRDFVWDGEQRLHLFDSIAKGLPLGSLMVWRTTMTLESDPSLGPIQLHHSDPAEGSMRQYLLDGRQRMTTIFAALGPGLWTREERTVPPGFDGEAPDGSAWALAYDLDEQQFVLSENNAHLPVSILLDDFGLDTWLGENARDNRSWYRRARALKSALHDYLVPVTPLHTDTLEAVTLTFKRVNRAGTPMGDLEMARALSWTSGGFDLADEIDNMTSTLTTIGWGSLDRDTVLKVLAAAAGQGPSEMDVETLAEQLREGDSDLLNRANVALRWSVDVLNSMGIAGPRTLPWRFLLVAIARVALEVNNYDTPPRKERLRGWVAEVCLTEAFAGAPPHVQRAMHKELLRVIEQRAKSKRRSARRSRHFSMAWARSRVSAVVLGNLEPKRANGTPMFENAPREAGQRGTEVMLQLFGPGEGFSQDVERAIEALPPGLKRSAANRVLCRTEALAELRHALEQGIEEVCASHAAPIQPMSDIAAWLGKRDELLREREIEWLTKMGGSEVSWKNEPALSRTR